MYHAVNISYPNPTLISPQTEFMITKPLGKFTVWCCSFRSRKYAVGCGCRLRCCQHSCIWLESVAKHRNHVWQRLLSLRVSRHASSATFVHSCWSIEDAIFCQQIAFNLAHASAVAKLFKLASFLLCCLNSWQRRNVGEEALLRYYISLTLSDY